jgi:mycothiol synthase
MNDRPPLTDRPPINDRPTKLRMRLGALANLPPAGMDVRRAGVHDATALAMVLATAFDDGRWTPDVVRKALFDNPEVVAVYAVDGAIGGRATVVATASVRLLPSRFPGAGYLHWVGAHPDAGLRGLGRAVSLAALADVRARGLHAAVLETDDHRRAAIRLYSSLGFRPEPCALDHEARWRAILSPP